MGMTCRRISREFQIPLAASAAMTKRTIRFWDEIVRVNEQRASARSSLLYVNRRIIPAPVSAVRRERERPCKAEGVLRCAQYDEAWLQGSCFGIGKKATLFRARPPVDRLVRRILHP